MLRTSSDTKPWTSCPFVVCCVDTIVVFEIMVSEEESALKVPRYIHISPSLSLQPLPFCYISLPSIQSYLGLESWLFPLQREPSYISSSPSFSTYILSSSFQFHFLHSNFECLVFSFWLVKLYFCGFGSACFF